MVRKLPPVPTREKRTTSGGSLQFADGFFRKIAVPFNIKTKFLDFFVKW